MASNCSIIKNTEGKIIKVLNPKTGKESKVFKQITELPHVESLEQAVDIYDEVLKSNLKNNPDFKKENEDESITIVSGNTTYNDFKQALEETNEKTINIVSNGTVIANFPSTLDERTSQGLINSLILDNVIESKKVIFNGETYFQATGKDTNSKITTEEFLKEYIPTVVSKDSFSIKDGLIKINPIEITETKKGTIHRSISDNILEYFSNDTELSKIENINENNLKLNLLKILSDMGVSVITLQQYQDRFKRKSQDIPPSAEALADIVNRVVAFKDGQLNLNNLTEEVMHFIVETLPQQQIEEFSELIKQSQEYQDYYEQYKEVFNNDNSLIEKEILGKILKNITLNKVENKSKSFISKLIDIIKNFFDNLTLNKSHRDKLKQLNKIVEKFVIQQKGENFSTMSLKNSQETSIMYSLSDKISSTKNSLDETLRDIKELRQFNPYKRYIKNQNFDQISAQNYVGVIDKFIEISDRLIESTKAATEKSNKTGKALSGQNYAILNNLNTRLKKDLQDIATELKTPQQYISSNQSRKLIQKLEENVATIERLRSENIDNTENQINDIVEKLSKQYGELESDFLKAQLKKALKGEVSDVNLLFSFFGQLHHASNPILNLISNKIWEKTMKTAQGTKEDLSDLQKYMEEKGFKAKDLDQFFDPETGYMKDLYDHKSFETVMDLIDMETFVDTTGQEVDKNPDFKEKRYDIENILLELNKERKISKKQLLEKLSKLETFKKLKQEGNLVSVSDEVLGNYYREVALRQQPYEERKMSEEYYKRLEDKYKKLNISGETINFLKNLSAQRGAIKAQSHKTIKDKDRVIFTPEAKEVLNSVSKIRKVKKSIYSSTGLLKSGLYIDKPESDSSIVLTDGTILTLNTEGLTDSEKQEATISFEINKLDIEYINNIESISKEEKNKKKFNIFNNFITFLESNDYSNEELLDLISSNIDITINQNFYNNLPGYFLNDSSFLELNENEVVNTLKKLYLKRKSLLSIHRNSTSPFEIDNMNNSAKEDIRSITNEINELLKKVTFPENIKEQNESIGSKTINETYKKELEYNQVKEGTSEELDFILKGNHADTSRLGEITNIFHKIERGLILTNSENRLISDFYVKGNLMNTRLNFIKSKMYPYYTRFAPIGYKSMQERINEGKSVIEILNELNNDPYLDMRFDPSFEESSDLNYVNKNYRDEWKGSFKQPKKGRFENKKFKEEFGINEDGKATKKQELFKLRDLWLEARIKGLEKMEDTSQNPFKMIQISKTTTQQLKDIISTKKGIGEKISSILELLKEMFAYRVDDVAYGVEGFESNKLIPKYYSIDLENPEDISSDHFYTLTQFVTRANERKAKKNIVSDIQALYDGLINSKRNSKDKTLKNTIKMVDNLIDQSIYGKVENWSYKLNIPGTDYALDLAKVTRLFTKFVSLKNLGFNLVVPVTGALTAQTSKIVEQWIGEKVNKDSSRLANKEFGKLWKDATTQSLNINDNSEIFLIGQAFGLYDLSERARNARFGKLQRTLSKSAMALHTLSNFTVTPRMVLSILFDNRIVGNKIMNRQQFLQEGQRQGKNKANLISEWKTLEDNNIKKYMNFDKNGFSWKSNIPIKDKEYLEGRKLFLTEYIQDTVSSMEGQLPNEIRTMAQRNAIGSLALLHRGFLSIFLQKRLKKRGFNTASGLIEEGSYRTLGKMVADFVKSNDKSFLDKLKQLAGNIKPPLKKENETKEDFDNRILEYELEVRNMRRVSKEMASLGLLTTAGALIFAMADDDENEDIYALQLGAYFTTRLLNESSSSFSPSIFRDTADIINSPMVPWETAKELTNIFDIFDGDEVKNGKYKGLTKSERFLIKNTFGSKGVYDLYGADNVKATRNTYEKYNLENINLGTLYYNKLLRGVYKN